MHYLKRLRIPKIWEPWDFISGDTKRKWTISFKNCVQKPQQITNELQSFMKSRCCPVWLTDQSMTPSTINYFMTQHLCAGGRLLCSSLALRTVIALLAAVGKKQLHLAPVSSSQIKGFPFRQVTSLVYIAHLYHCCKYSSQKGNRILFPRQSAGLFVFILRKRPHEINKRKLWRLEEK